MSPHWRSGRRSSTASIAQAPPAYVKAAVEDAGRPAADKDVDVHRKPAEMLAIAGIKPGSKVGEMLPGGGYFTRIFSKAVGPNGKVFALITATAGPGRAGARRAHDRR